MPVAVSMPMLLEDIPPQAADIKRDLMSSWPKLPPITEIEQKETTITFNVGNALVCLGRMPAPIPWSELEGPCATSILWRNAAQDVKRHKFHWIVSIMGELDSLDIATRLTQVSASFLAVCPSALGIYWGNATLVVPKNIFIDIAKQSIPQNPPLLLWIDVRVGKDSENTSCGFTTGLAALGFKEFETRNVPESPADLRQRLMDLAAYVVWHDPTIRDGDTVGRDAYEKIRVVYSNSMFGHEGQVMRLEFQQHPQKKPWWKLWG